MGRRRHVGFLMALGAGSLLLASCGWGVTEAAERVTDFGAELHGTVLNTVPGPTTFHFEYGLTTDYGSSSATGTVQIDDPDAGIPVSSAVSGLAEGTTYHYRLCAQGADGHGSCGDDQTVTTTSGHDYVIGRGTVFALPQLGYELGGMVDASSAADGSDAIGWVLSVPGVRYFRLADAGPVSCLRVDGNRATIGFVADPLGIGDPADVPVPMVAFVEDNAGTGVADRWASHQVPEALTSCPAATDADFAGEGTPTAGTSLMSGDFVVHDHVES